MDNLSHAAFGGAIVHAIWGKKYGNKPVIYALLASNLPDIDVFVRLIPWVDAQRASFFHRTLTHSFLFVIIIAPLLGFLVSQFMNWLEKRKREKLWYKNNSHHAWSDSEWLHSEVKKHTTFNSRKDWTLITLVAVWSHLFLDWCTTYGVWLLWPFIDFWFESNIIGIIDFFFTLPLVGIVLRYIFGQRTPHKASTKWRFLGLWFATVYLATMAVTQQYFKHAIAEDMNTQWVKYDRIFVAAQMLQPFMWYGMVELPDGSYKLTYRSVFDKSAPSYENTYGYHETLAWIQQNPLVPKLITRAHGWYQVEQTPNALLLQDMRFGRLLWWDTAYRSSWMFAYNIDPITGDLKQWGREGPRFNNPFSLIRQKYWERVSGN